MRPDAPINKESAVYQMVRDEEMRKSKGSFFTVCSERKLTIPFFRFVGFARPKERSCRVAAGATGERCDQARVSA